MNTNTLPATILAAKEKFELACKDASALQIVSNFGAAFTAVNVIALLREAMTDEVMDKVFMPLMNTKIGFLTDRNGRARGGGHDSPRGAARTQRESASPRGQSAEVAHRPLVEGVAEVPWIFGLASSSRSCWCW